MRPAVCWGAHMVYGSHNRSHAESTWRSLLRPSGPSVSVGSRRWFLQASAAGAGMVSLGGIASHALAGETLPSLPKNRAVILFWLSGGPSQVDMWDPKPEAPRE